VVFPIFPSALLLPLVALAGSPDAVADGRFFLLLAGLAPAALFLTLEKLRQSGESKRSELENLVLACLFCFGSVYFFSSVQGTVWFAAHVVAAVLTTLYLLCALQAERPLLAGVCLALAFATRAPLLFAAPLFVFEAVRRTRLAEPRGAGLLQGYDLQRLLRLLALFASPIALMLAFTLWHNQVRFDAPFENGYRYLSVVWAKRIAKWGLFDYHYLARNLGVMLTSLPWFPAQGGAVQINAHGLALWVTTPMYLWLLGPKRWSPLARALLLTALLVALPTLFYQNTGWVQFGYRFSNDYAPLLFVVLAIAGPSLRGSFMLASAFAVIVNFFGALTFGRPEHARFYVIEPTQRVLYQPD
jgi:Gpi18-like mannosyltransferase